MYTRRKLLTKRLEGNLISEYNKKAPLRVFFIVENEERPEMGKQERTALNG